MENVTPNGARVLVRLVDGTTEDITEGVQAMYDLVINSLDWGSGLLTVEEALPIVHVAQSCGFAHWEAAQTYVDEQERRRQRRTARAEQAGGP